jgi:[ribosomal protein S5]-alanine N-acetyltransferase
MRTIETERLVLREPSPDDTEALFAVMGPAHAWQKQAVEPPTVDDTREYIRQYFLRRGTDEMRLLYFFIAVPKDNPGAIIAQASLQLTAPHIASLGFGVDESQTRRGYGSEIARRMLSFGFGEARLHRIQASVAVENEASSRLLDKIGMHREGVARDCIFAQGRWWSEVQYALIEDEFGGAGPCPR